MIKKSSGELLKGKWGMAIVVFLVYAIITSVLLRIAPLVFYLVSGAFLLGISIFSLSVVRNKNISIKQLFDGFSNFVTSFLASFFMTIFIFLWSMLLIIPGIIKSLSYSMTFFIIADNKKINYMDAITRSRKMMDGHKAELFGKYLYFLILGFLCIFTLGIGFLWLFPYIHVELALFYENIKTGSLKNRKRKNNKK